MSNTDFDPDAYLSGSAKPADTFDPDAYLAPVPPRATGRERERYYRESIHAGSPELPAGREAEGPDLSAERHTPGEIAGAYGQLGKGVAKGVPAFVGSGFGAGDIESGVRSGINAFAPPNQPIVSPQSNIPTTTEGGVFGPRFMGKHALLNPAANPLEAAGMQIPGMLLPGMAIKGPSLLRGVPKEPPGLPPGGGGVGATAAAGPLDTVSPQTISTMRKMFEDEGVTPWTVEQRLDEMSPHQSLGEFSPNTEAHMGAVASPPGAAKNEVIDFFGQRAKDAKDRLRAAFDEGFGEKEDLAQLQRTREIDRSKAASPLYQAFRDMPIPPWEGIQPLIKRLEAADAFGIAKNKAALEGVPWREEFFGYGPFHDIEHMPTAQSWDYVKRALDHKIADSFDKFGRSTDYTRIYTQLKNDLVSAIDNHPNPQVAGVWQKARQAFATPAQITSAERLGRKIFSIDADELPFLTSSYSDGEMAGFRRAVRKELEDRLGRPGRTDTATINQVLAPNNQQKFRWIIGDQATDNLLRTVEQEQAMHGAGPRVHGGSQTALRESAKQFWTPQGATAADTIASVADTAFGAIRHPVGTAVNLARKVGLTKANAAYEARLANMRDEAARLFTLQGPQRDAVIRYLTQPQQSNVVGFARGGPVKKKETLPSISSLNKPHGGDIETVLRKYRKR
jgi:hypothetical protein